MNPIYPIRIIRFLLLITAVLTVTMSVTQLGFATETAKEKKDFFNGFLYFSDKEGRHLKAVEHQFPKNPDPRGLAVEILNTLIQGPPPGLRETLPDTTRIRSCFVTEGGEAFVDIDSSIEPIIPGGAASELLALYSLVNSLILNISDITSVKILIRGMDAETLAGHMDLNHFYKANMLIIR